MRHLVNFGLLFVFAALAVTGLLAFLRPFSITTTQVHITAGLGLIVLAVLHIAGRLPYFKKGFAGRSGALSKPQLAGLVAAVAVVLVLAALTLPPLNWLVGLGYEARNRAQIVRSSSLVGFAEPSSHRKLIVRASKDPNSHGLSLHLSFPEHLAELPAVAVWAETTAGTLIETLHLEPELAWSDNPAWQGARTPRNHILPIWRNRYTAKSGIRPDGSADAMTGATESHSYALDPYLVPGEGKKFIVSVEVNLPADANERWTDPKIGQPSLLYTALVKVDAEQPYSILELTGHGGSAEDSGNVHYDLEGFTSAKALVDLLLVKVEKKLNVE